MTLLAAENITVKRGGKTILRDMSFQAHAGEFIAMLGPNGAGKSTLLKALAGLIRPDSGQVMLDAANIAGLPPRRLAARRAYLPQNPHLEWPLPVERLVALGLLPKLPATGALPEAFRPAIARALEACDLLDKAAQPATTLSGGEFARAMLARAIVAEPQILIVDEPITGLDPKHAMQSMALLKSFAAAGTLVIASLHDLTLAGRYASRILVLFEGAIIRDGDGLTEDIIHRAFGVRAMAFGAANAREFTLLSPDEA